MYRLIMTALLSFAISSVAFAQATKAGEQADAVKPASEKSTATDSRPALPGKEEVELILQRILGYDRQWKLMVVRAAEIPGLAEVIVRTSDGFSYYYVPSGGGKAILGEIVPFNPDPYADVRARLQAADGPGLGAKNPVITVVEFSDLQCPYCKSAQPVLEKLTGDFPQIRYIFEQYPLPQHKWAQKAANYADCVGRSSNEAFWKYVDNIFENQKGFDLATADAKFTKLATDFGVDGQQIAACAASPETAARVKKSTELGWSVRALGTPTVFINGRKIKDFGDLSYEQLKALVQFEIDHAGK